MNSHNIIHIITILNYCEVCGTVRRIRIGLYFPGVPWSLDLNSITLCLVNIVLKWTEKEKLIFGHSSTLNDMPLSNIWHKNLAFCYFIITLVNIFAVICCNKFQSVEREHCVPRSFCFLGILPLNIKLHLIAKFVSYNKHGHNTRKYKHVVA